MKHTKKLVYVTTILLFFFASSLSSAQDQTKGFIAVSFGNDNSLSLTNGAVDSAWDNVTYYQTITEFGTNGYVKFAQNGTYLYALLAVDSSKKWAAVEFIEDEKYGDVCMAPIDDGWTFYLDSGTVDAHDTHFAGSSTFPKDDSVQNLQIETTVQDNYYYIEVARPLVTNDPEGNDFDYKDGSIVFLKFASDTNHKGGVFDDGPSELYYLSIQFSDNIVVPNVTAPKDFSLLKTWIFFSIPFFIFGFIAVHAPIRLKYRKVHDNHPGPIVDDTYRRPTIKEKFPQDFPRLHKTNKITKSGGK